MGDTAPSPNGTPACIAHTVSTYLPNPATLPHTHPPTHLPTQVRQQRVNPRPVSEIGSCYIGKQSRSGRATSRVAPSASYPRYRWPLRLSLTTTGYPSPSTLRRQPKPSPRILAQTRASLLLLILLLPLLAGWLADLAGWLALILEPRGRCTGCRSGAHYDELQANAAVGVEDRRSIAARFSKAERSVDLICAEATCVPTLLLCI